MGVSFRIIGPLLSLLLCSSLAWGWSEHTHRKMVSDAVQSVRWLDQYQNLKPTDFGQMLKDVSGKAEPVGPDAFNFSKAKVRKQKHEKYIGSTASMPDGTIQRFARHLLLSNQTALKYSLKGEKGAGVNAKQILSHYSSEPDWGMDKGLDASKHQKLMGGTNPNKTSSQGFRHMSFLLGTMGEAPQRAQLCFDLGRKAIEKGHPYWGFRFVAWGMHYLEDMGTPVHTNMLPTLKYIRVKGMLRPKDESGKSIGFNKKVLGDLVKGSTQINANYHFLYEAYVNHVYKGTGKDAKRLSKAVQGKGEQWSGGWLGRKLAPRSIKAVAKRRAWSRLSTPTIARNTIRFLTGKFRKPAEGAASNTVGAVDKRVVARTVQHADRPLQAESARSYRRRMQARDVMLSSTVRQFRKNGVALRRAVGILGKQLGKRSR
jgi:hypothetical protein